MGSRRRRYAALAVALGACGDSSTSSRSDSEVAAVVAELATREEQYKVDEGRYLATGACTGDPVACAAWAPLHVNLRVTPPIQKLACSYAITTGTGGTATPPSGFTMKTPPGTWYFIVATCPEATFFASSVDLTLQRIAK
jgi:hypothetical protein